MESHYVVCERGEFWGGWRCEGAILVGLVYLRFAAETALKGVSGAVGKECAHSGGCESRSWLRDVVTILVCWVTVDALPLGFAPADTPC